MGGFAYCVQTAFDLKTHLATILTKANKGKLLSYGDVLKMVTITSL